MPVPNFIEQLERMKAIHEKKNQDYSSREDAFSNFEQAAVIASWFNDPTAKVFATMIGIKLSRIANLMNKGGNPNNESLDDSFLDNDTYSLLFHCWYLQRCETKAKEVIDIFKNLEDEIFKEHGEKTK